MFVFFLPLSISILFSAITLTVELHEPLDFAEGVGGLAGVGAVVLRLHPHDPQAQDDGVRLLVVVVDVHLVLQPKPHKVRTLRVCFAASVPKVMVLRGIKNRVSFECTVSKLPSLTTSLPRRSTSLPRRSKPDGLCTLRKRNKTLTTRAGAES